jgi:hypothetical protein
MVRDSRKQNNKNKGKRSRNNGSAPSESTNNPNTIVNGKTDKTQAPALITRDTDAVLKSPDHNAYVVIGGDRTDTLQSGYGALEDHAAEIRLVAGVGRGERESKAQKVIAGIETKTHFNPKTDSAFIKISEKCNIDHELGLANSSVPRALRRSAIGMSADAVRITADEGIKIVTKRKRRNSKGALNTSAFGVDIIAGNDAKRLEPMVKGKRLVRSLRELQDHISDINGILSNIVMNQFNMALALASHWHHSPFFGIPTTVSPSLVPAGIESALMLFMEMLQLIINKINLEMWKFNTLYQFGGGYICSRYNNVN